MVKRRFVKLILVKGREGMYVCVWLERVGAERAE